MKKYIIVSLIVVGIGIAILSSIAYRVLSAKSGTTPTAVETPSNRVTIVVGDARVDAEVVQSTAEITKGLSGRATLADGQGMLFVMAYPAPHKFWMPDMRFAIDIIWLDERFVVVDVTEHATPESYPTVFMPSLPALYVLEVPAGYARAHQITVGEQAILGQ